MIYIDKKSAHVLFISDYITGLNTYVHKRGVRYLYYQQRTVRQLVVSKYLWLQDVLQFYQNILIKVKNQVLKVTDMFMMKLNLRINFEDSKTNLSLVLRE